MNVTDFLELSAKVGIKTPDLIAGFAGGLVSAIVFKKSDPWSVVSSVVVGAFTANYIGEPIAKFLGMGGGAAAFICGLAGMAICQALVDAAKRWRPGPPDPRP